MRPTVNDIAREAGVSLATVDRVLNARPGVRPRTVEAVMAAIGRLGYVRDVAAANLARQRVYRFAYVLPDVASQFVAALRAAIAEAGRGLIAERSEVALLTVPPRDPHALVLAVEAAMEGPRALDGLAVMAHETPEVRDLIARLKARRVAVVSLVTDQPNAARDHFVGIDNIAAGRTAGTLLGRFAAGRAGPVAVVVSSMLARDMVERRLGFDAVLAARFPALVPLPSVEGHDDRDLTARVTAACLAAHPGVVGVYCAGAGTRGVARALREAGLAGRVVVIAHELTPHTRAALVEGTLDAVIAQDCGHLARSSLRLLRAVADGLPIDEGQERIRISILLRENLPPG
jgi:LacI family transcriptional regulator